MRYLAVFCMVLVSISEAVAQMTHEETVVRAAYARLSYAARTGVLLRYAEDARFGRGETTADLKNEMDSQLDFQFRSFTVGNLADIAEMRWDALVSKPQQDLITVAFGYENVPMKVGMNDPSSHMSFVTASWLRWEEYEADWTLPVKKAIADLPKDTGKPEVSYSRYAAYSVTAALTGRQRTYQAIFLFGRNPDGSEAIYFVDHVLGMGVFDTADQRSFYPQPLLETYMRELPGITEWVASAVVASSPTAKDVVCDGATGVCGIPRNLLEKSLSVSIDPETRKFYQLFRSNRAATAPSDRPSEVVAPSNATSCAGYNSSFPSTQASSGTTDHSTGSHSISQAFNGTCTYTSGGSPYCNSQCQINGTAGQSTQSETGKTVTGYCHVVGLNYSSGNGAATNGASTCAGAAMYGGADECSTSLCDCTISVSVAGIVTGTGKNIWTANVPVSLTCNTETDPNYCGSVPSAPSGLSANGTTDTTTGLSWNAPAPPANCTITGYTVYQDGASIGTTNTASGFAVTGLEEDTTYSFTVTASDSRGASAQSKALSVTTGDEGSCITCDPGDPDCGGGGGGCSPVIVDTTGHGFHLTSAKAGVRFDIAATGHPIQIAWTAAGSGNAFLALDRNHNGKIDNGKELFGNFTQQRKSDNPNGYLALAEFDLPENGGNGDGIIDSRDAVYSKLLLWIDENHDGISQPNELHTLPELGVFSISLKYRREPFVDQHGNWFRYRSALNPDPLDGESKDGRSTYDVFLVTPEKAKARPQTAPQVERLTTATPSLK